MTTEPTNEADLRVKPGAELRKARENLGRSLEDVAHEMHMKVWQLEALENDDYDQLASPVFVQGYIRSYARLLEQDAEPLLKAFSALQGPAPQPRLEINPPVEESRGRSVLLPLATALITAALVAAFVIWLNANGYLGTRFGYTEPNNEQQFSAPLGAVETPVLQERSDGPIETSIALPNQVQPLDQPALAEAVKAAAIENSEENKGNENNEGNESEPAEATSTEKVSADSSKEDEPKLTDAKPADKPQSVPDAPKAPVKQEPKVKAPQAKKEAEPSKMPEALKNVIDEPVVVESEAPPPVLGDSVSFAFDEDSWVEVRDATGDLLVHGLREAGFVTRVQGEAPYQVFLGNAPGVTIEINKERFDITPFIRSNRTARFLLQQD